MKSRRAKNALKVTIQNSLVRPSAGIRRTPFSRAKDVDWLHEVRPDRHDNCTTHHSTMDMSPQHLECAGEQDEED